MSSPANRRGGSSAAHGQEGRLGLDRVAVEGAAAGILPRGRRPSPSTFFPSSSFPTPLGASGCICGRGAGGCGRAGEDTPMELGYWAVSHTDTYPILSFWAQYSPVHRYGLDTYPQRICSVSVSDTYRIRDTAAPPRIRVSELHFVFM